MHVFSSVKTVVPKSWQRSELQQKLHRVPRSADQDHSERGSRFVVEMRNRWLSIVRRVWYKSSFEKMLRILLYYKEVRVSIYFKSVWQRAEQNLAK